MFCVSSLGVLFNPAIDRKILCLIECPVAFSSSTEELCWLKALNALRSGVPPWSIIRPFFLGFKDGYVLAGRMTICGLNAHIEREREREMLLLAHSEVS